MEETTRLNAVALEGLRNRITNILPTQIRKCLDELSEEQLWWRPNNQSNSVGNLVLHVSGSMRHYLSRAVGGFTFTRDRPAEFAERGRIPMAQLRSIFDEAISEAKTTLDSFEGGRFVDPTAEPDYYPTFFDQILGVAMHLAVHTGQIVYVTKMLKEGCLDELWIQVHKKK
jgi:uncharacterized damage-inducible protein DinB